MIQVQMNLIFKKPSVIAIEELYTESPPDPVAYSSGISGLCSEILPNGVEEAAIVILDFPQLQKILARQKAMIRKQVHYNVSQARH